MCRPHHYLCVYMYMYLKLEDIVKKQTYSSLEYKKFRFYCEDMQEQAQHKDTNIYLQFKKPESDQIKTFLDPLEAKVSNTVQF